MPYISPSEPSGGYRGAPGATSAAAARAIMPRIGTIAADVLDCLRRSPAPLTSCEIAERIGRPYVSVQPRTSELARAGLIEDSGERKTGPWGVNHIAWQAVRRRP